MSWLRLLRNVSRPAAGGLLLAVVTGAGAAGAGVGLMATAAWLISRAALHPPVLHLMVAIVAVRAFGISRGVLRYVERLTGHDAALRVLAELRVRLFTRLDRLAPAGLAAFRRADLVQRMVADVDAVLDMLTRVLLPYAVAGVVGIASVVLVGSLLPIAGIALAAGLVTVAVVVPLLQSAVARRSDGRLATLRGELATEAVDLLHGLSDLTAYGAVDARLARLDEVDGRLRRAAQQSSATAGVSAAVTALATGLCLLIGLGAGAVAVRAGTLSGELLAVVVLTPLAVFEAAAGLPAAAQRYATARGSLRRLAEVFAASDPVPEPATPAELPDARIVRPEGSAPVELPAELDSVVLEGVAAGSLSAELPRGQHTLRLEGVTAGWRPGQVAVRDLDLVLAPGRHLALVGPSGSGKTTVAALLVRWLDPVRGRVTLDGVDLRSLPGDQIRAIVGYLSEDAYLFDTSIEENLRIGRRDATPAQLRDALAAARLLDWTDSLPQGLGTLVGEHGLQLSGGQRRRLALARALLADFPVLILDEPTEHLDDETASGLTRDLLAASHDRTVLLITHRTDDLAGVHEVVSLVPDGPGRGSLVGPAPVGPAPVGPAPVGPAPVGPAPTGRQQTPSAARR